MWHVLPCFLVWRIMISSEQWFVQGATNLAAGLGYALGTAPL